MRNKYHVAQNHILKNSDDHQIRIFSNHITDFTIIFVEQRKLYNIDLYHRRDRRIKIQLNEKLDSSRQFDPNINNIRIRIRNLPLHRSRYRSHKFVYLFFDFSLKYHPYSFLFFVFIDNQKIFMEFRCCNAGVNIRSKYKQITPIKNQEIFSQL